MDINLMLLKQISIFSAIAGGALGVLTLIPIINIISFPVLIIFLSAAVLVYMKHNNLIGIIDIREGSIFGAVIGFVSFVGFSVVYIPLSMLLGLIFKNSFLPYFLNSFGSFVVLIMLVIFLALLSALMNGFTGLATAYVYEILSGIKKESNEQVDFEIK